ncbi:MAG: YdcF family protein [Acidobacteriaceae bacterium]
MIVPETNLRLAKRTSLKTPHWLGWAIAAVLLAAAVLWVGWVDSQIRYYSARDEAQPADAIAVFGAAEYDGRPSPVLRARLDHGLALYQQGIAPLIITLGGGSPADRHSEGGVGRSYLMAHGLPSSAIIAETESSNTEQSVRRLAVIARANRLRRIVVVSDGTHLFRVHALCSSRGLDVLTSPRPEARTLPLWMRMKRVAHEILSYTFWRGERLVGIRA